MNLETFQGIGECWVIGLALDYDRVNSCLRTAIVVQDRIEDIECILWLLSASKGAQFHDEKWTNFANVCDKILVCAVKIWPDKRNLSAHCQGAIYSGKDVCMDIIHRHSSLASS